MLNEPDEVTDGSTDWVIDWKLGGGVITIGDDAPFEAEFLDICFKEGRTADPRTTDAPQTWSWMGEFTGRLMRPYFPYLENEEPQSIKFRSEEHTSELQSLMRNSYAVFCLKKKTTKLK